MMKMGARQCEMKKKTVQKLELQIYKTFPFSSAELETSRLFSIDGTCKIKAVFSTLYPPPAEDAQELIRPQPDEPLLEDLVSQDDLEEADWSHGRTSKIDLAVEVSNVRLFWNNPASQRNWFSDMSLEVLSNYLKQQCDIKFSEQEYTQIRTHLERFFARHPPPVTAVQQRGFPGLPHRTLTVVTPASFSIFLLHFPR